MSATKQSSAPRRRLACDRCHSFKLKCPRSSLSNDETCGRCLKAGVSCSYSPSMRGQVRPKQQSVITTAVNIASDDGFDKAFENEISMTNFDANDDMFDSMVINWTVPENDVLIDCYDSTSHLQPLDTNGKSTSSTGSEVTPCQVLSDTRNDGNLRDNEIRVLEHEPASRPKISPHYLGINVPETLQSPNIFLQLTSMSITLEGLARQLPSFAVHRQSSNSERLNSGLPGSGSSVSDDEVNFGVEKAYAMTHRLADIYILLVEQMQQRKSFSSDSVRDPTGRSIDLVDYPLLWLLFSCHNRLIDLWHAMLVHAKMVQDADQYSADAVGVHKLRCARFKMGSYEPSSSSAIVAMEIMVLQELAMHLATRLNNLIDVVQPKSSTDHSSGDVEGNPQSLTATIMAAQALYERALAMRAEICQRKSMLEESIARKSFTTND